MQTTLGEVLEQAGARLVTIGARKSLRDAASTMNEQHASALLVLSLEGQLCGLITHTDIVRHVEQRSDLDHTSVASVMSRELVVGHWNDTINEASARMTGARVHHLPVLSPTGRVLGVVSLRDLVLAAHAETERNLATLTQYVYGPI